MTQKKIAVIGGGAWGIALANIAAQTRDCVTIWMRRQEEVDALIRDGESRSYLPGLPLLHPSKNKVYLSLSALLI